MKIQRIITKINQSTNINNATRHFDTFYTLYNRSYKDTEFYVYVQYLSYVPSAKLNPYIFLCFIIISAPEKQKYLSSLSYAAASQQLDKS